MEKLKLVVLISLFSMLTSTLLPFHILAYAGSCDFSTIEFNIFDDFRIKKGKNKILIDINHEATIPESPLADIYRQALGVSNIYTTGEEVPIPDAVGLIMNNCENGTYAEVLENVIPIREQFYKGFYQEFSFCFGFNTSVIKSSTIPKDEKGACKIYVSALAYPRAIILTSTSECETWALWVCPPDTEQYARFVFIQITFIKMLMNQLPSEQVYKSSRSMRITLPDDARLLNADELNNLCWNVDFGGGNSLEASLHVESDVLTLYEKVTVTEDDFTVPITDLYDVFQGYRSFEIRFSILKNNYCKLLKENVALQSEDPLVPNSDGPESVSYASDDDFSWSFRLPFPTLTYSADSREGDIPKWPEDAPLGAYLTCEASLNLAATFSIQWDPTVPIFGLNYFRSSIKIEAEAKLEVEVGVGGWTYSEEFPIFNVPITKVVFFIGPVPVNVDLILSAYASIEVSFQVGPSVSAGCIITGWLEYGVQYDKNGLRFITDKGMNSQFIPPDISSGTEIVVEISPSMPLDLWARFYGAAGPSLRFEPYLKVSASYAIDTQQVTIEVTIGIKVSFIFKLDENLKKLLKALSNLNLGYGPYDIPLIKYVWTTHHDVGITNMKVSKSNIYPGDIVTISVTVKNLGNCHDSASFDVRVLWDSTQIDTKSISDLPEGSEEIVDFTWDTTGVPSGEQIIKAELLNISPQEESEDYAKNNIFEIKVEVSPIDFYVTCNSSKTWYKPGETTETKVYVKNMRGVRTSFWLGVSFKDVNDEYIKYDPQILVTPQSTTLDPGEIASFTVSWTIPSEAPSNWHKCYKIAVNCWKDGTFTDKYLDNVEWTDIFYVYKLQILLPTSSIPAIAGDPSNPTTIQACVHWIPMTFGELYLKDVVFSAKIGDKPATCEIESIDYLLSWFGLYELKIYPPAQPNDGLYDLNVTVTLNDLRDSAVALQAVEYVSGPSLDPIHKGLAWLRTRQLSNGSWRNNVGVTSLVALAFLNAGYNETTITVRNAINYILINVRDDGAIYDSSSWATYETSLAILPLIATHNSSYAAIIENAKNWLIQCQWDEGDGISKDDWRYGGFGYSIGARPDLSNTQFAALALDAAGLPKDHQVWSKLQVFLHRCQKVNFPINVTIDGAIYTVQPWNYAGTIGGYDGGFLYLPGSNPYTSGAPSMGAMTGAGLWCLFLSGVPKTDRRVTEAINWVINHYTWDTNPNSAGYRRYYYYLSMAKALTMYGEKIIGGHDWYLELYNKITSEMISVGEYQGYWNPSQEDFVPDLPTAYAILALQTRVIAPPSQRLSYLTFILRSNCLIRVIDPNGNLVGYNYISGAGENNIPRAIYLGPISREQIIVIINPEAGTYKLELLGIAEGTFELTIQGNYGEEVMDVFEYIGEIKPAELYRCDVIVTAIVGPIDVYASPPEFEEIIDNIPPTTTLEIGEPKYIDPMGNIYVTSATPFTLTAEDNSGGTGVASTFYRIYNSTYDTSWLEYIAPFYLIGLADGEYSIDFYSVDNIGNTELTNTVTVILDNTQPATTLTIGEPKYTLDTVYVTPDTPFTLEATDAGSGVFTTAYRIFNSDYDSGWRTYTGPFNLAGLIDGVYTIEFNSTDNLGNTETTNSVQITLFSWNYIFTDSYGRGTILKINLAYNFIQFITPDKDYGIREATYMRQCGRTIIIKHCDNELRLITAALDTKLDFCVTTAWDQQTRKHYLLIDKVGNE
ncbi:MAG: CARDB domain-containing protein [Conexivisphaerales archaeon]